ncbi:Hypothetical predicted protein [Podarcis lilfordi]|uniref:Uncharacterized protein n=1 Tax=Podarcis lilfordi TaxID=74358 RepID=A0AA35PS21_9SAUR|nr:Hypothetical predicted protein [Podarcis lilfordi]
MKCLKPRQARWALFFAHFNFQIAYRPSTQNGKANALSRRDSDSGNDGSEPLPMLTSTNFVQGTWEQDFQAQVRLAVRQDPFTKDWLDTGPVPSGPGGAPFDVWDGRVYHHGRLYILEGLLRSQVLEQCHDV